MTTESVKHRCETRIFTGMAFHGHLCNRPAKVERNGKHYCGTHDPVSVAEKRAKRDAEWRAEEDRQNAVAIFRASIQTENERRLALFDEMLAALREAHQVIGLEHTIRTDYGWREWLDENITHVIAKAEGKS